MDPHLYHEMLTKKILDEKFKTGHLNNLSIPEKLETISKINPFGERVKALQANSERSLNTILLYTFGDYKWKFTKEDIDKLEYKEPPADEDVFIQGTNLNQEAKRLYIFMEGEKASKEKLSEILLVMLENLHPDEGKILKGIFEGNSPYKNITKKLVATAFPDLFPDYKEEEKKPEGKSNPTPKPSGGSKKKSTKQTEPTPEKTEENKEEQNADLSV
ncbi:MAG: hypothetical protein EOM53_05940 [Alphaproteobacteria bacterium]|nr:hypothetical protein [Alphaproteobacteria bacterium]